MLHSFWATLYITAITDLKGILRKVIRHNYAPATNAPTIFAPLKATIAPTTTAPAISAPPTITPAFIANLGHHLWGSQSMQELTSGMRNNLPFLIRDAYSCIECEPHKGCPRFATNASIHLTQLFAFSAFSVEVSFTTVGFENGQNLKLILEKMHKSEKMEKRHMCLKNCTLLYSALDCNP